MHPDETAIHDYVDDVLGPDERAGIRRHLEACVPCRSLAAELDDLRRAARALGPLEPPARVWSRVQQAVRQPASQRRPRMLFAGLAAAAVVLVLAAVIGVIGVGGGFPFRSPATQTAQRPATDNEAAQSVESELRQAEDHYEKAIKGLEQIANDQKGSLDSRTADTLQKNLAVIDQAISESRAAVRAQPNSEPAEESLLENFKTKISVLQDTLALVNEMRKGDGTGAARIVSGLQKGS